MLNDYDEESLKDELEKVQSISKDIKNAEDKFKNIWSRCKRDLEAANGIDNSQYSDRDDKVRGEGRAKFSFPILDKFIERVVGNYNASPFGIQYESNSVENTPKSQIVSSVVKGIENRSKGKDVYREGLRNATTVGYGWIHVTTEYDNEEDDSLDVSIKLESIKDYSSVLIDPLSTQVDGSDANWIAHVDYLSPKEAKSTYGSEVLETQEGGLFESDFSNSTESDNKEVPLVTYYCKEDNKKQIYISQNGEISETPLPGFQPKLKKTVSVKCIKIVGNKIIFEHVLEGVKSLPIVPVYGLPKFHEGTQQYTGIVHPAIDTQTLLNYSGSLAAERLALGPKSNYIADIDAISPFMETWKNSSKSYVPVLPYKSKDKNGVALNPPIKQDTAINVSDVVGLQNQFINIVSSIIGMPDAGMAGDQLNNESATSALLRERSQETILSTLYENLASSITQTGKVVLELLASTYNTTRKVPYDSNGKVEMKEVPFEALNIIPNEYEISVQSGPMMASQRKENLRSLLAVSTMLGPQGVALLPEIVDNIELQDETQTIKQKVEMLANQVISAADQQGLAQQAEMMAQENAALKQQVDGLTQQVLAMTQDTAEAQIRSQTEILKTQMNNETKMDVERLKQFGGIEKEKTKAELEAEQLILEQKIELEKQMAEYQAQLQQYQNRLF